jgi:hypothetical protein
VTTGSETVDELGGQGVAAELGVYDDLLTVLSDADQFQEWGIIEHCYAELRPSIYRELVSRYSHTALGPTHYSVSAFLSLAASKLAGQGHLTLRFVAATGYWSYNSVISAFALSPANDNAPTRSWEQFARERGFDPLDWPALGYHHGDAPPPKLVRDVAWTDSLGPQWFDPDQLSYRGLCAWNHNEVDAVPATRLVVTELRGVQDARACCDECMESVRRYVGAG